MKLTALITTLVLGTSSIAMASPRATVTASAEIGFSAGWSTRPTAAPARNQVVVRDHRDERDHRDPTPPPVTYPRGQGGRPVTPRPPAVVIPRPVVYVQQGPTAAYDVETPNYLTIANGLNFTATDYRKDIGVSWANQWNKIHISANGSAETITQIGVKFDNGVTQVIQVNQTILGNQQLTFDLDGINRTVSRVLVYGSPAAGGSYNSPGFSVSLL